MTNIDKLSYLTNLLFSKIEDTEIDLSEEECDNIVNFSKDIRKDLRRLEELEKVVERLKEGIGMMTSIIVTEGLSSTKNYVLAEVQEVSNNEK